MKKSYFYLCLINSEYYKRFQGKLDYGMLGVNDPDPFAVQAPFGGVKQSGLGREGNKYGVEDCLKTNEI